MISHKQAACICIDEQPRTSASPIHIHARRSTFLFGDEKSKQTAHRALALVRVRQFFFNHMDGRINSRANGYVFHVRGRLK
jgi:hypothetical protein